RATASRSPPRLLAAPRGTAYARTAMSVFDRSIGPPSLIALSDAAATLPPPAPGFGRRRRTATGTGRRARRRDRMARAAGAQIHKPVAPCRRRSSGLPSAQPEVRGMDRRAFVTGLGAVLVVPLAAEAQQREKTPRIGVLFDVRMEGFQNGLKELGYVEGRNLIVDWRWTEGKTERAPEEVAAKPVNG